jgi:hypothetical protein
MTDSPRTVGVERRIVRRTFAVIFGVVGLLVGAALVVGAGWLLNEERDDDGFYVAETHTFERASHAVVSGDFDQLTEVPSWLANLLTDPVDVRIAGSATDGDSLFIGIAATDDVDRYLSGVNYDEVKSLDIDGRTIDSVDYAGHEGTGTPRDKTTTTNAFSLWVRQGPR